MQTVHPDLIRGKKVLLRYDIDVPIENGKVTDDFRLKAGLDTLNICLQHAESVILMGHIGRPEGKEDPAFSVKPVVDWFEQTFAHVDLPEGKFHILENLRFEPGEDAADLEFAKELAAMGDFFVNESFAAHHPSASTTVLPTLLPHAAGLRFAQEVQVLTSLRQAPKKPLVAIIGGAKIEDKLGVLNTFASLADAVIVGGKLPLEIKQRNLSFPGHVLVARLNEQGVDIAPDVINGFKDVIYAAKQVVWAGPIGKFEEGFNQGTLALAEAVIQSGAYSIIGGGDTISALTQLGLLDKFSFVSCGGGAMLKLIADGTLPTIEALN